MKHMNKISDALLRYWVIVTANVGGIYIVDVLTDAYLIATTGNPSRIPLPTGMTLVALGFALVPLYAAIEAGIWFVRRRKGAETDDATTDPHAQQTQRIVSG